MRRAAALAALAMAAGCSARRSEPITGYVPQDDASVERGRMVFMQNCYKCHPNGEAGVGPALNNRPTPVSIKRFEIRHGVGPMPAFDQSLVSDIQLDDLMAYLAALRRER